MSQSQNVNRGRPGKGRRDRRCLLKNVSCFSVPFKKSEEGDF